VLLLGLINVRDVLDTKHASMSTRVQFSSFQESMSKVTKQFVNSQISYDKGDLILDVLLLFLVTG